MVQRYFLPFIFCFCRLRQSFCNLYITIFTIITHKTKLNTQTISIGIVYIIVCNSLMLFLPHSHYISIGCYMVALGCVHYTITIAVISPLCLWQRRSIADSQHMQSYMYDIGFSCFIDPLSFDCNAKVLLFLQPPNF